tara:strand:- start:10331 stop:12181 length:1851 start_codon:yes stop_codon:yes gene_type:complete
MSEEVEILKSIKQLIDYSFFIPAYQRGYRWDTAQVYSLLDDISGFETNFNSFYCLQPFVLKQVNQKSNTYELIDGQQRATTIYLILTYFKEQTYELTYKTRGDDETGVNTFLQKLSSLETPSYSFTDELTDYNEFDDKVSLFWKEKIAKDCPEISTVDNFYFYRTYAVIKNWSSKLNKEEQKDFLKKLLEQTKVIWYVEDLDAIEKKIIKKFINFNEGRIELEQAELIKALFALELKKIPNNVQQKYEENQFADEWNQIEHQMGEDKFWQFVSKSKNDINIANKINLLFQLYNGFGKSEDYFYNYRQFEKAFKLNEESKKPQWKDIVGLYNGLEEWYFDRTSYHLIGAIIHLTNSNISEVINDAKKSDNKIQFRNTLRDTINSFFKKNNIWKDSFNPNKIKYGDSAVFKLLLLYNISLTQIDEVDSFFPFHRFYNVNSWNIEHILAKNDDGLESYEEFRNYSVETIELINSLQKDEITKENRDLIIELCKELDTQIELNKKIECKKVIKTINEKLDEFLSINDFNNLCLLDQSSNIKVGKKPFRRKRNIILKLDKEVNLKPKTYIPIGTQYVFSKKSTPSENYQVDYWSQKDKEYYLNKVESITNQFLKHEENGSN